MSDALTVAEKYKIPIPIEQMYGDRWKSSPVGVHSILLVDVYTFTNGIPAVLVDLCDLVNCPLHSA